MWLFPWSFYLPAAIRTFIDKRNLDNRRLSERGSPRLGDFGSRTRLLCWILAGLILVFFAISTNQEYYTFPAYFPLLMLLADGMARCEWTDCHLGVRNGCLRISAGALAAIGLAASATLLTLLWQSRHLPFEPDIGNVLATHNMDTDTLSTSHMLDLSYASFCGTALAGGALAAVALMVAPLLSFLLRLRQRHYAATWVLGAGMAVFLVASSVSRWDALGRICRRRTWRGRLRPERALKIAS